jgi:hypothetical protein
VSTLVVSEFGIVSMMLQLDAALILRYWFIFVWKRVYSLDDSFMAIFLSMANLLVSGLVCWIEYMLGFHAKSVAYKVCTHWQSSESNSSLAGQQTEATRVWNSKDAEETTSLTEYIMAITMLIHIFYVVRMSLFKLKLKLGVPNCKGKRAYNDLKKQSLFDNLNMLICGLLVSGVIVIFIITEIESKHDPGWFGQSPGRLFFLLEFCWSIFPSEDF